MIKYNDTYIIGIDHGYGNLKTANTVTDRKDIRKSDKAKIEQIFKRKARCIACDVLTA